MIACLRFPFFPAAVEQRDHQPLRARPLVLGGQPWQRAKLYSFSVEAARSGVRLGATLRQAQLLCPDAAFRPPLTAHYNDVVRELFGYFLAWSERVEPCSTWPAVVFYADLDSRAVANVRRLASEMGQIARRVMLSLLLADGSQKTAHVALSHPVQSARHLHAC